MQKPFNHQTQSSRIEKLFTNRSISVVHVASCNRIRTRDRHTPCRSRGNEFSWISGRIESEGIDPRRRPFKRCSRRCTRLFVRVVWSFHQTDQGGPRRRATMMTLIRKHTPQLHRSSGQLSAGSAFVSPSWPCISCTNNALFSAYTYCWRICLFRNMIAAILFPVYVRTAVYGHRVCPTCGPISCRFTIPSRQILIRPRLSLRLPTRISFACTAVHLPTSTSRSRRSKFWTTIGEKEYLQVQFFLDNSFLGMKMRRETLRFLSIKNYQWK